MPFAFLMADYLKRKEKERDDSGRPVQLFFGLMRLEPKEMTPATTTEQPPVVTEAPKEQKIRLPRFKFKYLFRPNAAITETAYTILGIFWCLALFATWALSPGSFLPTPWATIGTFTDLLYEQNLLGQLWTSFVLNMQGVAIMSAISLLVAYATVLPFFRPFASIVSLGRFNGFVALPLIFTSWFVVPHKVMIALLVYGMAVFTVLSLTKMIDSIPKELYDHSRTLRMGEWRVVWEVVILGRLDEVIDILRINIAMGWMMLQMVEGRFKFEGGVGAMMEIQAKHFDYASVFCTMFVILLFGMMQDYILGTFKKIVCPYAFIGTER